MIFNSVKSQEVAQGMLENARKIPLFLPETVGISMVLGTLSFNDACWFCTSDIHHQTKEQPGLFHLAHSRA